MTRNYYDQVVQELDSMGLRRAAARRLCGLDACDRLRAGAPLEVEAGRQLGLCAAQQQRHRVQALEGQAQLLQRPQGAALSPRASDCS